MDLAYLVVGVSKNEEKDFIELYDRTHYEVFGLSLALVKDRVLAREITIETYRRVKKFAGFFDTDMNAEYWILDIAKNLCINAMRDKDLSNREGKLDNVSKLLKSLIADSTNDRGTIMILKALSELKMNDIANLLWYYNLSARNEYRRGIRELKKGNPELDNITDINDAIRKDISYCVPNVFDQINTDKITEVAYISHEAMSIDENTFTGADAENEYIKRLAEYGKSTRKARYASLIILSVLTLVIVVGVIVTINRNYEKNLETQRFKVGNEIALIEVDGTVFYQNYKDKSKLYSYNTITGEKKKLCDDFIKELTTDGTNLFYRNKDDSRIYRINFDGTGRTQITQHAGSSIFVYEDYIYYSSPNGINRMKKDGTNNESIIYFNDQDVFRYDIAISNDIVYFSGGAGKGIYYIESTDGEKDVNSLYFEEAYDLQIIDDLIYFNVKTATSKKQSFIYRYDLQAKNFSPVSDILSGSGAYYMYDGELYIDGYIKSTSGTKKDQGVYKITPDSGQSSMIIPRISTYLYVSDRYIYSYSTDNQGSLVAYDRNDINKKIVIF